MTKSYLRGHEIIFVSGEWIYSDTKKSIISNERPCIRCGKMPTPEGYDACIGFIPRVTSACCGHGEEDQYQWTT